MIIVDADVLLIDLRYPNDARFAVNRKFLERVRNERLAVGMTSQALLEVVGVLSFNLSAQRVGRLPQQLLVHYALTTIPDLQQHPEYAGCTVQELIGQMTQQMSLGDAVQAVQIAHYASTAEALLTWNAIHFAGKVIVPVLTPEQWLNQAVPPSP